MTPYRQAAVTAYICLLVGTFAVFAFGVTGLLPVKDPFLWFSGGTFAAGILAPLVVAFKIPGFWNEDPNSVAALQRRHTEEIASLKKTHAEEMARVIKEKDDFHAHEMARKDSAIKSETERADKEAKESARLRAIIRPKPPGDQTVSSALPPRPRNPS